MTMRDTTEDGLAETAADPGSEPTTTRTPRISSTALGAYQIGGVIGRGGMGEVVAAHDPRIEREVALKRMREANPDPDAIARFVREAKIQARLDHPAIVPVHEVGTDETGLPFFTMKRLDGTTLAKRLEERAPIQPLLRAFVDVCFAIQLAHERGVIHRDLKPSNIMLGNYGDVYVLDWGVAHVLGSERSFPLHLPLDSLPPSDTATGAMLGTPGYMAPEQMRGEDVGAPADVYALGAILFEILAGETLHPLGRAAIASTLGGAEVSPGTRRPERAIAPELDALCSEALAEQPAARPTARALAERIQHFLDGDRDLEHRRRLAADHVVAARAAAAAGHRSDAIYRAGRALALEPESAEAAELVTSLLVSVPDPVPAEATLSLEELERALDMDRSRRGVTAYLMVWIALLLAPLSNVKSWPLVIGLLATGTVLAAIAYWSSRTGRVPLWPLLTANLVLVALFSRVAGPFVLTPLLAVTVTAALATHRRNRMSIAIPWLVAAIALPFVLEWIGVFAPTWTTTPEGMLSRSTMYGINAPAIIVGTIALALVGGVYILANARKRAEAQRITHLQAWQLRQLLPRERR